jgi:hypothetical protein
MNRVAWASNLGSEFDAFLFASIGEDKNGMMLSVVSALARLDIDPWQEASSLNGMPVEIATKRLAFLIKKLPEMLPVHLESGKIAERLIALLPSCSNSRRASPRKTLGIGAITKPSAIVYVVFFLVAIAAGVQILTAGHQPPSGNRRAPSMTRVVPPPMNGTK